MTGPTPSVEAARWAYHRRRHEGDKDACLVCIGFVDDLLGARQVPEPLE